MENIPKSFSKPLENEFLIDKIDLTPLFQELYKNNSVKKENFLEFLQTTDRQIRQYLFLCLNKSEGKMLLPWEGIRNVWPIATEVFVQEKAFIDAAKKTLSGEVSEEEKLEAEERTKKLFLETFGHEPGADKDVSHDEPWIPRQR